MEVSDKIVLEYYNSYYKVFYIEALTICRQALMEAKNKNKGKITSKQIKNVLSLPTSCGTYQMKDIISITQIDDDHIKFKDNASERFIKDFIRSRIMN